MIYQPYLLMFYIFWFISALFFGIVYYILAQYGHYKHKDLMNCIYLSIMLQSTIGLGSTIDLSSNWFKFFIILQAMTTIFFMII